MRLFITFVLVEERIDDLQDEGSNGGEIERPKNTSPTPKVVGLFLANLAEGGLRVIWFESPGKVSAGERWLCSSAAAVYRHLFYEAESDPGVLQRLEMNRFRGQQRDFFRPAGDRSIHRREGTRASPAVAAFSFSPRSRRSGILADLCRSSSWNR